MNNRNGRPRSVKFYLDDPLDASLDTFMEVIGEKKFTKYIKERIFEHLMELTEQKFRNPYTSKGVQATMAVNYLKELQSLEGLDGVQISSNKPVETPPASTEQTLPSTTEEQTVTNNNTISVDEQSVTVETEPVVEEQVGGQPGNTPQVEEPNNLDSENEDEEEDPRAKSSMDFIKQFSGNGFNIGG